MLEEAVASLRGEAAGRAAEEQWTPQIAIGTSVLIPEEYVQDLSVRLGLYRRLSLLVEPAEIEAFAAELIDRFGPLPQEVENLLQIVAIKRLCREAGIEKRSEEHTSELQSLMHISYAVFCLKKKNESITT